MLGLTQAIKKSLENIVVEQQIEWLTSLLCEVEQPPPEATRPCS